MRSTKAAAHPTKGKAAPVSHPTRKAPAPVVDVDEKDDYIMNLKGQVYLLTIENEMLKRFAEDGTPLDNAGAPVPAPAPAAPAMSRVAQTPRSVAPPAVPPSAASARGPAASLVGGGGQGNASAILLASDLPPASYPHEINDAFEVMRQKYSHLETQYQRDLDEKRRAAEALASQCAAQSSLISTLKKEVEAVNETLAEQKRIGQQVEQRAAADLEVAQRDIEQLQERVQELLAAKEDLEQNRVRQLLAQISDLKTQVYNANAERNGAEAARIRALESYGRQFIATRMLLRQWKSAKMEIFNLGALCAKLRTEKDTMQRRTDEAEADAAQARAAAEAAAGVRDTAFARARQLQDTLSTTDAEVDRLKTEVANRDAHLAELDVGFSDLQRRIDAAQSATSKAVQHREHAMRKVAELQDLLTSKTAEADSLRSEAVTSQRKEAETRARGKALEGELAQWHARANALEGTTTLQQKSVVSLTADIEATSQQLATAEQEITTLRDELARRPPIDVIRQLDVDNLMQRNMQAAAAMQQLLAWQEAHASSLSTSNMTSSVARS